jgi:hypothetical protein
LTHNKYIYGVIVVMALVAFGTGVACGIKYVTYLAWSNIMIYINVVRAWMIKE